MKKILLINACARKASRTYRLAKALESRLDDGKEVRIILSANNQYMNNFNPKFSSIPAKSEAQIMSMLGQIAVGDSNGVASLLFATGDYAIQSTIGRSIENKLRDFLNFDILSVRTNVIQNALNYNLNRNNDESSSAIGNFFDNSTVYFGKYLGRSLYVDTLMHWSYDKSRIDDQYTIDGLVFRPEIGLELESPFVNIRWNMAPNLSRLLLRFLGNFHFKGNFCGFGCWNFSRYS